MRVLCLGLGSIYLVIGGVALIALSGCGTTVQQARPPVIVPVEVAVPVAGACVPASLAPRPEYPDTDAALKAATDAAERYQLLGAGRMLRDARLNELEPVVAGCPKSSK